MSKHRRAARVDANQNEIVSGLLKLGISVELGHDDVICGYNGKTYWYELKNPNTVSKKTGKILESAKKDDQKRLEAEFKGHYKIVSNIEEIVNEIFGNVKISEFSKIKAKR